MRMSERSCFASSLFNNNYDSLNDKLLIYKSPNLTVN